MEPQFTVRIDPREMDLQPLVVRALTGDEQALEALIGRVQPRVYALARAILRRSDWAEDATQDALMRMVENLADFPHASEVFDTWLLCIARNVALSLLRKHRVREDFEPPPPSTAAPAPDAIAIAHEDLQRVAALIDHLPASLREIIVLRYFHHLESPEIGRIIGASAVAVRVRISRAIQELRALLADEEQL